MAPLCFLIYLINKKVSLFIIYFFNSILLFTVLFLTQFFHASEVLLDKTVFYFSLDELFIITRGETDGVFGKYFWLYFSSILLYLSLLLLKRKWAQKKWVNFIAVFFISYCFILFVFIGPSNPEPELKYSTFETQVHTSKSNYFVVSLFSHLFKKDINFKHYIEKRKRFHKLIGLKIKHPYLEHPFLFDYNVYSQQSWSEYIDINDSTNVVIIFSEGLTKSYVNSDGYFGNLMPFFDSLSKQSLYWPNMLSITDRTHGVFSSSLAGLPHGFERGFLNYKDAEQLNYSSIPKLFKKHDYDLNFFYGGWSFFDNYRSFLKANSFERFIDEEYIDSVLNIKKSKEEIQFGWGYHDKTLFEAYFEFMDNRTSNQPYFNVLLSLSLHSPFTPPNEAELLKRVKTLPGITPEIINALPDVVSTILYTDDALEYFFKMYQKRTDFKNTVFLIFGDHNVHALGVVDDLDPYHVPFLLYSPLLKKAKRFNEIVSHWDIPISLLNLFPSINIENKPLNWLGRGVRFSNETTSPFPIFLGTFKGNITGVVWKDMAYIHGQLYKINSDLLIKAHVDDSLKKEMKELLSLYVWLNEYVMKSNKIGLKPVKKALLRETMNFKN